MFYFSYEGNKRNELKEINKMLENVQYKRIIEPFGGTCAFSISQFTKNKDMEIYISDIDKELILFCNNFYKNDDLIIDNVLKFIDNIKNKEDYNNFIKKIKQNDTTNLIDFCSEYLFYRTCFRIRPGLYYCDRIPKLNNLKKYKTDLNEFFKKNTYICSDYKENF